MIGSTNVSKSPATIVELPKYSGVASVHIVAINPNNDQLRKLGWNIPEGAEEPVYTSTVTKDDGTIRRTARVRFMVQIKDFEDNPVIPLDFWISPEVLTNRDRTKGMVIDQYGRTAWASNDDIANMIVPNYSNGPARLSVPYKRAHRGEEDLVLFLRRYLMCAPFERYDYNTKTYVRNTNPGVLTIDNWEVLCNGNAAEIKDYVSRQPSNCVKVILGIKHGEDNKDRQIFIPNMFISNGVGPSNGIYTAASNAIQKLKLDGYHNDCEYSDKPVEPYVIKPTTVVEDTADEAAFEDDTFTPGESVDDLPFGD